MEILMFIVSVCAIAVVVVIVITFVAIIRAILVPNSGPRMSPDPNTNQFSDDIDGINNGDYYNGPHGYSPMTGYPETQYCSGFDPEADWNHEEHD